MLPVRESGTTAAKPPNVVSMDDMLLQVYRSQVKSQCEFALIAARDLNEALVTSNRAFQLMRELPKKGDGDSPDIAEIMRVADQKSASSAEMHAVRDRIWFSLNAFLNAVANVSKLLWPAPKRRTAKEFPNRGEELRGSLGVAEDSPLQYRTVRNHFEHIDERIEEWWLKSERHNIASRMIGPLGKAIQGLDQNELFEQFDADQLIAAFQGDVFELQPIMDEISALYESVCAADNARWRRG